MPKPETPEMAELWAEAMNDVIDQYKDARRQVTKETNRPLEGEPMTKAERQMFNARMLGDDTFIGGHFEEMASRFQVPPGRVPRRLVEAILRAAREEPRDRAVREEPK